MYQCFGAEPNNRTAPLRGAKNLRAPWRRAPAKKKTHVLRSAEQKSLELRSSAPERKSAPEPEKCSGAEKYSFYPFLNVFFHP